MQHYEQEELLKLFDALPVELRAAVMSETTANLISELSKKYKLLEEQKGQVAGLIGYVLMGLLSPMLLAENLQQDAGISTSDSQAVTADFIERLFSPLQDILEPFYPDMRFTPEMKITRRGFQKPTPTAPNIVTPQQANTNETTPAAATKAPSTAADSYREPV